MPNKSLGLSAGSVETGMRSFDDVGRIDEDCHRSCVGNDVQRSCPLRPDAREWETDMLQLVTAFLMQSYIEGQTFVASVSHPCFESMSPCNKKGAEASSNNVHLEGRSGR